MAQTRPGRWRSLFADFAPRQLPLTLATGLVLAMVNTLLSIALVSLIFSGDLRQVLPVGIGIALVGSAAVAIVIALGSSFPGTYAGIQDASAAILSLSAAAVVTAVTGPDQVETVLAMIAVTSLATGFTFLALGYFRWGEIARFVPFPVIGGLLAGTGFLIVIGALEVLGIDSVSALRSSGASGLAWPGLLLVGLLFVTARRGWPNWMYLVLLGSGMVAFHVATVLTGIDTADALSRGWLLGPIPAGGLWPGLATRSLAAADWSVIATQTASLASILVIAPISVLLYLSAVEIETKRDLDLGADLRATGWANVVAAGVGGAPGYMYLADTVMTHRLVGPRRGAAVVAGLAILGMVAVGGSVLEFIPQFVVGGILLFYGLEFLVEWLWIARKKMNRLDYLLMVVIVIVIATVGFLEGVAAGLIAAIVLFVVRYSRIDVVKHSLTGREHQSNIERAATDAEYLRNVGEATLILELQGFVFFGTASRILSRIRTRLENTSELQFVVCDFRRVTGVDSSAVAIFERIALVVRERATALVLTGMAPEQRAQFDDLVSRYRGAIVLESDLDHGTAWCEDRLLEAAGLGAATGPALPESLQRVLGRYLERRVIPSGELIMRQGDPSPGIYLISSGQATVQLDEDQGHSLRLRTLLGGTVLGEISLYRNEPVTATVVADTDCEVLHLSPDRFDEMCRSDPVVAAELHQFVARTLAGRVSHANTAVRALHD